MRVALVGNSHLAAFKAAEVDVVAAHPGLQLWYLGLPNPIFFQSRKKAGAALHLSQPPASNRAQLIVEDGPHPLVFADFDLVLLTSHGFYLRRVVEALAGVDILGHPRGDQDGPLISLACAADLAETSIRHYAKRLQHFMPAAENMAVIQAPYPAASAAPLDGGLAWLAAHPARERLFAAWRARLIATCGRRGLHLFEPPQALLAGPFQTDAKYARATTLQDDAAGHLGNHLHMTPDYAAAVMADVLAALR
ncbi:MAG: hypothetical protein AAF601_04160 [Pseudomonadota bacterium]